MKLSSAALGVAMALVAFTLQGCTPPWCGRTPLKAMCGTSSWCYTGGTKRFSWDKDDTAKCSAACKKQPGCVGFAFCSKDTPECKKAGPSKNQRCFYYEDCKDSNHPDTAKYSSDHMNEDGFTSTALYSTGMHEWSNPGSSKLAFAVLMMVMTAGGMVFMAVRIWRRRSVVEEGHERLAERDSEEAEPVE